MNNERPHPFDLLFGAIAVERFAAVQAALGDTTDVDAFVLVAPALELLRDLRPEEGLAGGIDDFVALVHAAYRYWRDGRRTITLDEAATRGLCAGTRLARAPIGVSYVQVSPRLIWGQLDEAAPFEPLDGWFALPVDDTRLRMVACFGVHPQRPGVSVVVAQGLRPAGAQRPDGTALFMPTMSGGDAAGLHAVTAPEELLLLGWRACHRNGED